MIHTHTHLFNGSFSGTTRVSWYQKGKTNLDFTEARDSEWQWHQLGHMQVYTSLHTDNHASTPPLSFLQAGCPSRRPTNSVKALKARRYDSPADNCFNLGTDEKDRIYNTGVMTGHLANGERYGVDGVTIGEANKRLVVCKQLEQEFVATETQNSISSKFQKKRYNIYNNSLLLQTCVTTFVMDCFHCQSGELVIRFVFSPAMNIQHNSIPADDQRVHCKQTCPLWCMKVVRWPTSCL